MILTFTNYRLYDALSGSIDNLMFKSTISIKHSFLHLGQKRGKLTIAVSARTLVRVLFPQIGQRTQKDFLLVSVSISASYMAISLRSTSGFNGKCSRLNTALAEARPFDGQSKTGCGAEAGQ